MSEAARAAVRNRAAYFFLDVIEIFLSNIEKLSFLLQLQYKRKGSVSEVSISFLVLTQRFGMYPCAHSGASSPGCYPERSASGPALHDDIYSKSR